MSAKTSPKPVRPMLYLSLLLCGLALTISGCNAIAAIAYVAAPRELHKAAYELPDKKTVIFVEDRDDVTGDPALPRNIAANIEKWLIDPENEALAIGSVVQPEELETYLASLGEDRDKVRLSAVAAHFDAAQLIYVKIDEYQMAVGGGVYRPQILTQVKVIDMDQRKRMLPPEVDPETGIQGNTDFFPVLSKLPAINRTAEGNSARVLASQQLAMRAGEDIAKLFFDWREGEPGEKLGRT